MPRVARSISTDEGNPRVGRLRSLVPIERVTQDYAGFGVGKHACPFHEDRTPSFHVYGGADGFHCFSCKFNGGPAEFVARLKGITVEQAVAELEKRYDVEIKGDGDMIRHLVNKSREEGMATVVEDPTFGMATALYVGQLTDELAEQQARRWIVPANVLRYDWRMGWDAETRRYTFPVIVDGRVVDVRRRAEDGRADKVISMKGGGRGGHLFGLHCLKEDGPVVVVGGEKDVIVGAHHLDASFVSGTLGESTWRRRWNAHLRDRDIVVWYDHDEAGAAGAREVLRSLSSCAASLHVVRWREDDPVHWDVSDVVRNCGREVAATMLASAWCVKPRVDSRIMQGIERSRRCRS